MRRTFRILLLGLALALAAAVQGAAAAPEGNPNVKVWANQKSGVYHCPGSKWYGKTTSGAYMTQKEAQEKGYRPAYKKPCQ